MCCALVKSCAAHISLDGHQVTVSTVGYGDMSPETNVGRAAVLVFIVVGIVYFGVEVRGCGAYCERRGCDVFLLDPQTQSLLDLIQEQTVGTGKYLHHPGDHFLLLCGDLSLHTMKELLKEVYHAVRCSCFSSLQRMHAHSCDPCCRIMVTNAVVSRYIIHFLVFVRWMSTCVAASVGDSLCDCHHTRWLCWSRMPLTWTIASGCVTMPSTRTVLCTSRCVSVADKHHREACSSQRMGAACPRCVCMFEFHAVVGFAVVAPQCQGEVFKRGDLERVQASKASAVFFCSNKCATLAPTPTPLSHAPRRDLVVHVAAAFGVGCHQMGS